MLLALCWCSIFVSQYELCLLIITGFLQREILEHFQQLLVKYFLLLIMLSFQKTISALFFADAFITGLDILFRAYTVYGYFHVAFIIMMCELQIKDDRNEEAAAPQCSEHSLNFHILILVTQDALCMPKQSYRGSFWSIFNSRWLSTFYGW